MSSFSYIKCALRLFAVTSWYCRESTVPQEGQGLDPFSISREGMQPRGGCWRSALWVPPCLDLATPPGDSQAGCVQGFEKKRSNERDLGSKLLTLGNPTVVKCRLRQIYFNLMVIAG